MDNQLAVLQHALGLDEFGEAPRHRNTRYRDYFIAERGSADDSVCLALVDQGLMRFCGANAATGGAPLYRVTTAGEIFVAENSPKRPKPTRSQANFQRYQDGLCDLSFGDWIRRNERQRKMGGAHG